MLDRVRLLEQTRIERIQDAGSEALELARRGAESQREIITTTKAMLQVMARAYVGMSASGTTCNFYLPDLVAGMPWVSGLAITGPDGRIRCATIPNSTGINLSDRAYYRAALESRDFVVSDYLIGRISRRPSVITVYPLQAMDPNTQGAVVAAVNLGWVGRVVSSVERRPGSNVLLVDGRGTVLGGDAGVSDLIGQQIDESELYQALDNNKEGGTFRATGLDHVRRIFGHVRVPGSDVRLLVGLDEADVLQRTDRELTLAYLQVGFFGLLVLMIAWFGGERLIVDPIRSLARTAERLGRGDLRARATRESWVKEFAPLAAALNDMAQRLADREQQLRSANCHLQELATSDALSGLANRRGFDARLAAEWQRAGKLGRPVGVLMIDVDHFKLFNDRYGHVEGDVCLRRIGKLLQEAAQGEDDIPARYGGEEFVLLLPGADVDVALTAGERLRSAVEEMCIMHASSPTGQVTISVGVASLVPGIAQDAAQLIEAADVALYSAKRRGRNMTVAYGTVLLSEASRSVDHQAA
jgi:diguanylate cyclase (GGDEF)-like protein